MKTSSPGVRRKTRDAEVMGKPGLDCGRELPNAQQALELAGDRPTMIQSLSGACRFAADTEQSGFHSAELGGETSWKLKSDEHALSDVHVLR